MQVFPHAKFLIEARSQSKGNVRRIPAIHRAGKNSLPENNLVNARWFPPTASGPSCFCRTGTRTQSLTSLCANLEHAWHFGAAAKHAVSRYPHAGRDQPRRLRCLRQHRPHTRCGATGSGGCPLLSRLARAQGYSKLGIVGTSLGSCYAFIAAAHDPRIRVAAFNHASTMSPMWSGMDNRRGTFDKGLNRRPPRDLAQSWLAVSPMAYFEQFSRWPRKSLIIYAKYDLTFLPELSRDVVREFERHGLDHKVVVLPCGHYTMGETPYRYMDGWHLASFLRTAFER